MWLRDSESNFEFTLNCFGVYSLDLKTKLSMCVNM